MSFIRKKTQFVCVCVCVKEELSGLFDQRTHLDYESVALPLHHNPYSNACTQLHHLNPVSYRYCLFTRSATTSQFEFTAFCATGARAYEYLLVH